MFIIHGDDNRYNHLAAQLSNDGYKAIKASEYEHDMAHEDTACRCVHVFSLTATKQELMSSIKSLREGSMCFGGHADDEVQRLAAAKNIAYHDLLSDEAFCILNSIPTAEGALMVVMQNTDKTVSGSSVAVLGYGRVGKATARIFAACNARVHVISREPDEIANAAVNGFVATHLSRFSEAIADADIILNTIPSPVLDKTVLAALKKGALVVDLASGKSNIDYKAAEALGLTAFQASALPAVAAPASAAEYMKHTILHHLSNQG